MIQFKEGMYIRTIWATGIIEQIIRNTYVVIRTSDGTRRMIDFAALGTLIEE